MIGHMLKNEILPTKPKQVGALDENHLKEFIRFQVHVTAKAATHAGINFSVSKIGDPNHNSVSVFSPQNADEHTPCIVVFVGNDCCVEEKYAHLLDMSKSLNCHVIASNYPDVGSNKQKANIYQDVVDSGIELYNAIDTLLGASDESPYRGKKLLYGHSLGGAVATDVAAQLNDNDVLLVNDRSFSTCSAKAQQQVSSDLQKQLTKMIVTAGQWDINAIKSYSQIKDDNKLAIEIEGDTYIDQEISLVQNLREEDSYSDYASASSSVPSKKNTLRFAKFSASLRNVDPHQYPLPDITLEDGKNGFDLLASMLDIEYDNEVPTLNQQKREAYNNISNVMLQLATAPDPRAKLADIKALIRQCPQVISYRNEHNLKDIPEGSVSERDDKTLLHKALYIMSCYMKYPESLKEFDALLTLLLENGMESKQNSIAYQSAEIYAESLGLRIDWHELSLNALIKFRMGTHGDLQKIASSRKLEPGQSFVVEEEGLSDLHSAEPDQSVVAAEKEGLSDEENKANTANKRNLFLNLAHIQNLPSSDSSAEIKRARRKVDVSKHTESNSSLAASSESAAEQEPEQEQEQEQEASKEENTGRHRTKTIR